MSNSNTRIVTDLCNSLLLGDLQKTCEFLSTDVVYHNNPWPAVTGHVAVREVLGPLIEGSDCALKTMDIFHSAQTGEVVMNARSEQWQRAGVTVVLPVAGVFTVRNGLITQWDDYWDMATLQPLIDTL